MEIVKEERICLPQLQYQVLGTLGGCEGQRVEVQAGRWVCLAPLLLEHWDHPFSLTLREITMEHDIPA